MTMIVLIFVLSTPALSYAKDPSARGKSLELKLEEAIVLPRELPKSLVQKALSARILIHAWPKSKARLASLHHFSRSEEKQNLRALVFLLTEAKFSFKENPELETLSVKLEAQLPSIEKIRLSLKIIEITNLAQHILEEIENILLTLDKLWPEARFYILPPKSKTASATAAKLDQESLHKTKAKQKTSPLRELEDNLTALLTLRAHIAPTEDGWLTTKNAMKSLDEVATLKKNDPWLLCILAQACLLQHLPQLAVTNASWALNLKPDLAQARYVRALAQWQLGQLGLAENDLALALQTENEENPEHLLPFLRARGAVRLLLGKTAEMCADFSRACGLGDCDGLKHARSLGYCLPE
ncbi:MAG: hypothetical protein IJS50_00985 [Desulfovibrio sp.]|nr:hypothetical protein [Desulfovibrio sp.]